MSLTIFSKVLKLPIIGFLLFILIAESNAQSGVIIQMENPRVQEAEGYFCVDVTLQAIGTSFLLGDYNMRFIFNASQFDFTPANQSLYSMASGDYSKANFNFQQDDHSDLPIRTAPHFDSTMGFISLGSVRFGSGVTISTSQSTTILNQFCFEITDPTLYTDPNKFIDIWIVNQENNGIYVNGITTINDGQTFNAIPADPPTSQYQYYDSQCSDCTPFSIARFLNPECTHTDFQTSQSIQLPTTVHADNTVTIDSEINTTVNYTAGSSIEILPGACLGGDGNEASLEIQGCIGG